MSDEKLPPPRVLCVDDQEELCNGLVSILNKLPARAEAVYDGNSAKEHLGRQWNQPDPYRLVILDMWVPHTPGEKPDQKFALDLLKDLQNSCQLLPFGTPIVIFTQFPSLDDCVACMRAGAVDYIPKRAVDYIRKSDEESPENYVPNSDEESPRKSQIEVLFDRCKEVLYPPRRPPDPVRQWLGQHINDLIDRYGGAIVGIVEERMAKRVGLEGEAFGGFVLVRGRTYEEVERKIFRHEELRWKRPPIINVPQAEEF